MYIETIVYDLIPMILDAIELADPGEKKIKRIYSSAILDAILILCGMNIINYIKKTSLIEYDSFSSNLVQLVSKYVILY